MLINIYAKAGEALKVVPYEKAKLAREYRENLVENVVDELLDVMEKGLNSNSFSEFAFNDYDSQIVKEAREQIDEILEHTPYSLDYSRTSMHFWSTDGAEADYFNYLMYLKDKYEIEDSGKVLTKTLEKPKHHSYR